MKGPELTKATVMTKTLSQKTDPQGLQQSDDGQSVHSLKDFFYGYIINIYSTFSLECSACHVYPTLLNPQSCPVLTEAVTLWPRPCFPASAVPHSLATNCPGHEGVRPGQVYRVLSLSVSSQASPTRLSGGTKAEVDSVPSSL